MVPLYSRRHLRLLISSFNSTTKGTNESPWIDGAGFSRRRIRSLAALLHSLVGFVLRVQARTLSLSLSVCDMSSSHHAPRWQQFRVAVVQDQGTRGDVSANLELLASLACAAHKRHVELLLLPELFLQGYDIGAELLGKTAVTIDGPEMARIQEQIGRAHV